MPTILKGGDGYTFDVNTNIGGLMGRSRYSYNYAPIYNGELLQNGGNNKNNCGCSSKEKKEDNLYNMLKQEGGIKTGGNQLDAIQYVSKSLSSLDMNSILSLIGLIFVYEIYTKNGKMHDRAKTGGSNISQIMAPLGRSNLIVLAALLLLHHFAVEMPENKKSLKGGNNIEIQISELLKPLGVDKNGISSLITSFKSAFGYKQKNNHTIIHKNETSKNDFNGGGSILKNIIAPLGTNAFIATGLLIILEKVFNKEKLEKKTDKLSKLKKGGTKNKDFQKLVDVITPLSFNIFANKSFIQTLLKDKQDKQDKNIKNNIIMNKLSGGRGLPLPGFTGHSLSGLGASGLDLNNLKGGKKKMKGGEESWGATGMPSQFYNPKTELVSYPFDSGVGVKTAYGLQEPLDIGRGMLAPNTTSKSTSANMATSMKTGGSKKNVKNVKNVKNTKKKIMQGGEESWGATGMPSQFYDPKTDLVNYPFNSGVGVKTAYGLQEPLDIGRGMLAPNTTSKSINANIATSMKTGGVKKINKKTSKTAKTTKTTKTTKTAKTIKKNNKTIKTIKK